jgi:hypothetical protein
MAGRAIAVGLNRKGHDLRARIRAGIRLCGDRFDRDVHRDPAPIGGIHPLLAAQFSPRTFDPSAAVDDRSLELLLEAARWAREAGLLVVTPRSAGPPRPRRRAATVAASPISSFRPLVAVRVADVPAIAADRTCG